MESSAMGSELLRLEMDIDWHEDEEDHDDTDETRAMRTSASARRRTGRAQQFRWSSTRVKHNNGKDLFCSISVSLLVLLAVQKEFNCLRISSIGIPPAILNGSQTTLVCNYELGPDDQLYSVTWYKDRVGFYRFQPATEAQDQTTTANTNYAEPLGQNLNLNYQSHHQASSAPPTTVMATTANAKHEFDWAGISLDLARSNSTHVHLKQVGLNSEGRFECEVIADAPTFATVSASRQMKVYVLPKRKPSLVENAHQTVAQSAPKHQNADQLQPQSFRQNLYQLNDVLNFTCTSGPSRPAARLSWFLNDLPIATFQPATSNNNHQKHEFQAFVHGANQTTTTTPSRSTDSLAETRSTLVLRLQAVHLRQLRAKTSQQQRSLGGGSYLPLKLSCVAQLSVEFSANTSLLISGGKTSTTTKRNRPQPAAVEPPPEAFFWRLEHGATSSNPRRRFEPQDSSDAGEEDEGHQGGRDASRLDNNSEAISIFRWPPSSTRQRSMPVSDYDMASATPSGGLEGIYNSDNGGDLSVTRKPMRQLVVWTNRQLRDQSEHIERLLARSSANELQSAHIEAKTVESVDSPTPEVEGPLDWPSPSRTDASRAGGLNEPPNRDFELHELVNFTCHHDERQDFRTERMHSVQLRWFLNDRELSGPLVNAYEPARGFYFDPNESVAKQATGHASWSASVPTTNSDARSTSTRTSSSLLVEFSPSLFRLNELNLRCKTIVEQPLIEFESVQWLYMAMSPFIQAQEQSSSRPSLFNVNSRHRQQHKPPSGRHQQTGRQHPGGNVIRMRHQTSQTAHSASSPSTSSSSDSILAMGHFWMLVTTMSCLHALLGA